MNDQDNDKRRSGKAGGGKRFGGPRSGGASRDARRPEAKRERSHNETGRSSSKSGGPLRERSDSDAGRFSVRAKFGDRPERQSDRPASAGRRSGPMSGFVDDRHERPRSGVSGTTGLERIAKVMARAGLCSRREAEEWILGGRVSVNGRPIASPALDVGPNDVILVDNKPLPTRERTRLWLYHKPRGLVTTADDPEGRPTVFNNLPSDLPRVISVGRLDINTEGLLLLTNDGGLARVLGHPTTGWLRRYRVRVHGDTNQAALDSLRDGITLDGVDYEPIVATFDRKKGDNAWLTMDLTEGKNREVKRVLEHLGLQVSRLIRISFGPFHLGDMPEGGVEEVRTRMLKDQLGPRLMEEAGVDFDAPIFAATETPAEEPKKRRYLSREGFQERRRKALLGEDESLKIERGAVADRKGRQIKVERIRVLRPDSDEAANERAGHRRDSSNRPSDASPLRLHRDRTASDRTSGSRTPRNNDERPAQEHASRVRAQGSRRFTNRSDDNSGQRRDGDKRLHAHQRPGADRPQKMDREDRSARDGNPQGKRSARHFEGKPNHFSSRLGNQKSKSGSDRSRSGSKPRPGGAPRRRP